MMFCFITDKLKKLENIMKRRFSCSTEYCNMNYISNVRAAFKCKKYIYIYIYLKCNCCSTLFSSGFIFVFIFLFYLSFLSSII